MEKRINHLVRLSKIDRRVISRWIKQSEDKLKTRNKRNRCSLECKKDLSECPLMENLVKDWILELRANGAVVSGFVIQND